jgi:hypothetical protein
MRQIIRYALEIVKGDFGVNTAVRTANSAAEKTIGKRGAQISIPWANELESIWMLAAEEADLYFTTNIWYRTCSIAS